jgi:hypothetical protein
MKVARGSRYGLSVWVRARGQGDKAMSGTLTLWALGGTNESASKRFTVGERWALVSAGLVPKRNHTALRAEVYLASTSTTRVLALDRAWMGRGAALHRYTGRMSKATNALVARAADYWNVSPETLARRGVAALAYIAAASGGGKRPIVPEPRNTGPVDIANVYDGWANANVRAVNRSYVIDGDQAQYVGAAFMVYVAAVVGGL